MRRYVMLGALIGIAAVAEAAGTSLLVTSRPARSSAKLVYGSSDALAGLAKGTGTDAGAISVDVFILHDGALTVFAIPAGVNAGDAGWTVNDAARARFTNRDAPDGPTGVSRTTLSVGRRVKLAAKSLGDSAPLALTSAPSETVRIAYVVRNGAETLTHCTQFAPDRCTYAPIDGGTGRRLRCRGGVADPSCGARPVCGNGIRERGEQCDGGPLCTNCLQGMSSCCQGDNQCLAAPAFSLQGYLYEYCSAFASPPDPRSGMTCSETGQCVDVGIAPTPTCCQDTPTTCTQGTASSIVGVWQTFYYCLAGSGDFSRSRYNAICSPSGACLAQ